MSKPPPRVVRRSASSESGAPARKRSRSDKHDSMETLPQPPGLLRKITLKNFMCHEHLNFELNSRINFIKGDNGSGKSAVLTAVMVGLGARAATTDRGRNITGLIRTGQKSAVVSLTLDNSGDYAVRPEKYGGYITVERTLRDSGTSSYRLTSEMESRPRPMHKGELVSILDALSIQVDNPLVILTQEMSKNFLRGEDPKKKYQLFLDATRLSHIKHWYEKTRKEKLLTANRLETKQQSLRALKEEVKRLEYEANAHKHRADMERKLSVLKTNLLWAQVIEEEIALEKVKEEEKKREEILKRCHSETDRLKAKLSAKSQVKDQLAQLDRERAEQAARVDQVQQQLRELTAQWSETGGQMARAEDSAVKSTKERDGLKKEIERLRLESQPDYEEEARARRQARAALDEQLQELVAVENTRSTHLNQVSGSLRKQKEELKRAEDERQELDGKIRDLERQLNQYRRSQADPRAVFGPWVAAVDRDIETAFQQRRLRRKPIGPVGAYVRVKAGCEEWKPLVETCLGSLLRNYLVDDKSDLPVVSQILKKHTQNERERPGAIASRFLGEVHDISRHAIDTSSGQHVSVWSVLEIDNPVVANAVLDQARAESVLLLRTETEARSQLAHAQNVPRGCAQALTQAGFRYFPDPNYRTYPVNVPRQARFLQVSMEDVISDLSRQLQERRDEAQAASGGREPADAALQEAQRQEHEARRLLEDTRRRQLTVRRKIRELDNHVDPEPVNLQALEEEVDELDRAITDSRALLAPLAEKKENLRQKMEDCKCTLREAKAAVEAKIEEHDQLKTVETAAEELGDKLNRLLNKLKEQEELMKELSERVRQQEEKTRRATDRAAADGGERTNPTKSVEDLKRRIIGVTRCLEDSSTQPQISAEEALSRYQAEQLRLQQAEGQMSEWKQTLDTLGAMIRERDEKLEKLRSAIGFRVTLRFKDILEAHGFGGYLTFDHERQRLSIEVSPSRVTDGGGGAKARSALQLSGGERSFSTIAFLMAMWSVVLSPFRMLDEYDVFMDDANRRLGHDMLVSNALELNSQFAFFTPLRIMGNHEGDERVSLMGMPAPKRERN